MTDKEKAKEIINPREQEEQASIERRLTRPLTFRQVSAINKSRGGLWHDGDINNWSVERWALAMAGEAGEVCNAVKKLIRVEDGCQYGNNNPPDKEAAIAAISEEIADTFLYLDLLASRLGIDIEQAIKDKFNEVSIKEGFEHKL